MPRKRLYGEGTIRLRKDGLVPPRLSLGSIDGRRRQRYYFAKTQRAVQLKLEAARRGRDQGRDLRTGRATVEQFLERWLQDVAQPRTRPQTFERYRELVKVHIVPAIGAIPLEKLTPLDVQAMVNAAADGLAPRTVSHIHAVLRNALNQALRWGLVVRNVAELVDPPRIPDIERRTLSFAESRHFLAAIEGDRLEAVYAVGLSLGLRMGEVLGLRWDDVDLVAGNISVRRSL